MILILNGLQVEENYLLEYKMLNIYDHTSLIIYCLSFLLIFMGIGYYFFPESFSQYLIFMGITAWTISYIRTKDLK